MNKDLFCNWLREKAEDVAKYEADGEVNRAYMLGAAEVLSELYRQVREGKFDSDKNTF